MEEGDLIMEILANKTDEIDKEVVKEILEEIIGRELTSNEINDIIRKITDTETQKISKNKVY